MNSKKHLFLFLIFISQFALSQNDSFFIKPDTLASFSNELAVAKEADVQDTLVIKNQKTNDLLRIFDGFAHTIISPIRWKKENWLHFGGSLLATSVVSLADEEVNRVINKNTSGFYKEFADFGYHNGKPYTAIVVAGGFYLTGLVIKDEWTKETAVTLTSAYMTSGVLQTALKKIVGRARPTEGFGPYEFRPFKNDPGFSSFPSGHSQIAFVTSMVLAERVEQPWLKAVFYTGAAVTMASRMYANAHWLSDVSYGGFLAYICTKKVMDRLEKNKYQKPWEIKEKEKIKWNVYPTANGIGFIGTF